MIVLITGAGGFIGSHLADFFIDKNFEVYGTYYKEKKHIPIRVVGRLGNTP